MIERDKNILASTRQTLSERSREEIPNPAYDTLRYYCDTFEPAMLKAGDDFLEKPLPQELLPLIDEIKQEIERKIHGEVIKRTRVSSPMVYDAIPLNLQKRLYDNNQVSLAPRIQSLAFARPSDGDDSIFSVVISTTGIKLEEGKEPVLLPTEQANVQISFSGVGCTKYYPFDHLEIDKLAEEVVKILDEPDFFKKQSSFYEQLHSTGSSDYGDNTGLG